MKSFKEQQEQQNQMSIESENNPISTDIENFQITTLEIENNHLDEDFQNSTNDLDFNSFQKKDLSLDFDLPLSGCEKLEILEVEQNDNVEFFKNSELEKNFNEHEFFGLNEEELPNEDETDLGHESKFENFEISNELEIVSVENTLSVNDEKFDHIVLNNTQISNFTEFICDHNFLKNYTDKFVEHMNYFWYVSLIEKLHVRTTLNIHLLDYKSRFKDEMVFKNLCLLENTPRHSGNGTHRVRTKCGGKSWWNSLHRVHRKHIYHCTYDPSLHIAKLHFILQIILHLIHLWVLSFKYRKKLQCGHCLVQVWGGVCISSIFIFLCFYFFLFSAI